MSESAEIEAIDMTSLLDTTKRFYLRVNDNAKKVKRVPRCTLIYS